jgi:hypothetical protein
MQLRRDSACCEPARHEPLNGMSVSEIAETGPRVNADPLPVGCPPRTYRAGCVSTVVSHGPRGWLGESVPQQSVRRVNQQRGNQRTLTRCRMGVVGNEHTGPPLPTDSMNPGFRRDALHCAASATHQGHSDRSKVAGQTLGAATTLFDHATSGSGRTRLPSDAGALLESPPSRIITMVRA